MTPNDVVFGARKKVWWTCSECGYEYQAMIYSRTTQSGEVGRKCIVCANRQVHPDGRNSLAVMRPDIATEWHPDNQDTPHDLPYGSNKVRKWICSEGHEWQAQVSSRLRSGCGTCAEYGFKPQYPASLYVLKIETDRDGEFYKVGITNRNAGFKVEANRSFSEEIVHEFSG